MSDAEVALCSTCWEALQAPREAVCPKCGAFLGPHAKVGKRCWYCRTRGLVFDRVVAVGRYEGRLRELLLRFKFRRAPELSRLLSALMTQAIQRRVLLAGDEVVVAVPLHWRRRFQRGFNQSELLAKEVASHFQLRCLKRGLARSRHTIDQTTLMPTARFRNVKGAFRADSPGLWAGKSVLLVDDILTTGATASECARVLKRAGARRVKVAVVARAV